MCLISLFYRSSKQAHSSQPACCSVTEQTDIIRRTWATLGLCRVETEPPFHLDYQLLIGDQWLHVVFTTWHKYRARVKCCYRFSEWHSRNHPCKFVCSFSIVGVCPVAGYKREEEARLVYVVNSDAIYRALLE